MKSTTPPQPPPLFCSTWPITIPIPTLSALLNPHILFELVTSILATSIALIMAIGMLLLCISTLEYLSCISGITHKDGKSITAGFFDSLLDSYFLAPTCMGPDLGVGLQALEIDGFGFDAICSIGLFILVVVPKGFIEGKITRILLKQVLKLLWRLGWCGRSGGLESVADGEMEGTAEAEMKMKTGRDKPEG
jgi:hypothetical protein